MKSTSVVAINVPHVNEYNRNMFYLWKAKVWKPDMALLNSYEDYKQMGDESLLVYVLADGTVNWYPYQASSYFDCIEK